MRKRKNFSNKLNLYPNDKDTTKNHNNDDSMFNVFQMPPINTTIYFPKNTTGRTSFKFSKFYAKGCDDIVFAFQGQIQCLLETSINTNGNSLSTGTIVGYCREGASSFLSYCALVASALNRTLTLADIDKSLIIGFIKYLADTGTKGSTSRTYYTSAKQILVLLGKSGKVFKDIFPKNPYPNSNRMRKGETALSSSECSQLSCALKTEIKAIFDEHNKELSSYDVALCLLAIALRTGRNTTPLLGLSINCLQNHPFKTDRKLLISYKRRGSSTHLTALRTFKNIELMTTVMPDVDIIVQHLIHRTASIRMLASKQEQQKLFIYKSQRTVGSVKNGDIVALNDNTLADAIVKLVKKHQITDDNGEPLKLNISRLRKTFVNRLWKLTGNDPFVTAKLAGHTLKVSNDHYLEVSEEMMKDWQLMGEIRTAELLGKDNAISLDSKEENTPIGRCKNIKFGHFAPKNGEYCSSFLSCFRCRSYVVTGDDLYRLFSFYWLIIRERDKIGVGKWSRYYAHIVRIIDRQIAPQFGTQKVSEARALAKVNPHPFWCNQEQIMEMI